MLAIVIYPLVLKVKKGSIVTCSTKECLNCRLYFVCSYSLQSWTQKGWRKFTKLSKIGFSMECFAGEFLSFFIEKISKFGFCVRGWVIAIKSKHYKDYFLALF